MFTTPQASWGITLHAPPISSPMGCTQQVYPTRKSGRLWRASECQTGRAPHEPYHDRGPNLIPDIEAFEVRAVIAHYDGGLTLDEAEDLAAQDQGFGSAADYWHWLATYVTKRGLN